jgi:ASC-1-like (ASCH) protein
MLYPNEYLTRVGIKKGDIIIFTPDSEYEFQIDGVKMYRVYDHQVTIQLN